MTQIFYSGPSPYSAKIRMAAAYIGLPLELKRVDPSQEPPELLAVNPLGRIPVLVTEEDGAIFDSRAITQWLDRKSDGRLFPRDPKERTAAEHLEALADGVCDSLLAIVNERRRRPEEKIHQPAMDYQWRKVVRTLDLLESDVPSLPEQVHGGHIALRVLLGYLGLRFAGQWEDERPNLVTWTQRFDERFPILQDYVPKV